MGVMLTGKANDERLTTWNRLVSFDPPTQMGFSPLTSIDGDAALNEHEEESFPWKARQQPEMNK